MKQGKNQRRDDDAEPRLSDQAAQRLEQIAAKEDLFGCRLDGRGQQDHHKETQQTLLRLESEIFANRRREQHHPVQSDGGDRQTPEQVAPADARLNRGQPPRPHLMDHRHQGPGNRNQGCQAQVHCQHAERLFEPECPREVVLDRLIARRGCPEQHDQSLAHHGGHEHEERKAEDHPQHGAPPHVRFATQDLWVRGTVRREGTPLGPGRRRRCLRGSALRGGTWSREPGGRLGPARTHRRIARSASGLGDGSRRDGRPLFLGHGFTSPGLDIVPVPCVWPDSAYSGSPSSVKAAAIRARVDCRPSNSIDSNNGGETRLPVTAARTGPKASRRFSPSFSTSAVRNADSTAAASKSLRAASASYAAVSVGIESADSPASGAMVILSSGRNKKANSPTASERVLIRSWINGVAAASLSRSGGSGGSPIKPAAARNGTRFSVSSPGGSSRICAALIASHFLASKRAGLALTRRMSKASTISAMVKTSRSSAMPQPNSAR